MAKLINGLLGNSTQKVGNLVTYVSKGQQIARSKAANIANPRTAAQMAQRTKMANMVAFYRASKSWMEKLAFENKPNTMSVYNAFVKANSGDVQVHLTKQEAAQHFAIVAPYTITNGSLLPVEITQNGIPCTTNLYTGALENPTVGTLTAGLISNSPGLVREGMQLSVIIYFQVELNGIQRMSVETMEILLNTNDTTPISELKYSQFLIIEDGAITVDLSNCPLNCVAFAYVLSETVNGKTSVSSQSLFVHNDSTYRQYQDPARAAASYGSTSTPFLDSTE